MSTNSTAALGKKSVGWSVGISLLLILAGFLAIAIPSAAGIAVSVLLGWLLVLSGTGHLMLVFHTRSFGGLVWEWLLGILYFLMGAYLLLYAVSGLATVTLALAIYLFAEGILELLLASQVRSQTGWVWLMFDALVTLILATLILRPWPSDGEWVIGTLVGISMLFSGISRLIISLAGITIERHHQDASHARR
jgi:uncharacterized membrane protein HdeD (DUF308 family)